MTRFGVGPRIVLAACAYGLPAFWTTSRWPGILSIEILPEPVTRIIGAILIFIGVPMLAISARAMSRAFDRSELVTDGVFGIVRNPIYSAWIVFIIPGFMVLARSWPALLTPVVAYAVFKLPIRHEEEYLETRFGDAYRQYRARVNEIVPWPGRTAPRDR